MATVRYALAGLCVAALTLVSCARTVAGESEQAPYHAAMALGLAGPYPGTTLVQARAAGVTVTLVEMSWAQAEPVAGHFDETYLRGIREQAARFRAAGFGVALNTGLQDAPAWLLRMAGGRFVDQYGTGFTAAPVPNLVFGRSLRPYAQRYLTRVMQVMAPLVTLVRAGGGYWGELTYPYLFDRAGRVRNLYWAFDRQARADDPVPGWRPGDPSPHGEARRFLAWYLGALTAFQNWQVQALRTAGWRGRIAMLYPSHGMRAGDLAAAVATDLSGRSSAEINGEVQRGYAFARQVAALTDPKVVVYGTWGDNIAVMAYLAALARQHHRLVMVENAGGNDETDLDLALGAAARLRVSAFFLIRGTDLTCSCRASATPVPRSAVRAAGPPGRTSPRRTRG